MPCYCAMSKIVGPSDNVIHFNQLNLYTGQHEGYHVQWARPLPTLFGKPHCKRSLMTFSTIWTHAREIRFIDYVLKLEGCSYEAKSHILIRALGMPRNDRLPWFHPNTLGHRHPHELPSTNACKTFGVDHHQLSRIVYPFLCFTNFLCLTSCHFF